MAANHQAAETSDEGDRRETARSRRQASSASRSDAERRGRARPESGRRGFRSKGEGRRDTAHRRYDGTSRKGTSGRAEFGRQAPREDRIEGRHPFLEAVIAGRTVDKVWLQKNLRFEAALEKALDAAKEGGAVVMTVERSALDRMSDGRNHQGIVAQIAAREYTAPDALIANVLKHPNPLLILGDEIHDPHNLGALLRVIDAAGAGGLMLSRRRSAGLDAAAAKASAGALEHVEVAKIANMRQMLKKLKEAGFWILAADTDGEDIYRSTTLDRLIREPLALILGNEGHGISAKIMEDADLCLRIPMAGEVNSLNVSVAAAVQIFEIQRRRRLLEEEGVET